MMKLKNAAAGMLSFLLASQCLYPAMPANAENAGEPYYYYEDEGYVLGDVDADGDLGISDVVLLQGWLLGRTMPEGTVIARSDMTHDGVINVYDLIKLKRALFAIDDREWIEQEKLMTAPISYLKPTLPSTGKNKLLMLVVDFPDCKFSADYSLDQIRAAAFGPADTSSEAYPYESVSAYYERSSYGALTMDADIYTYSMSYPIDDYIRYDSDGKPWADTNKIIDEVLSAKDSGIDFRDYDINSDGYIDTVLISAPDTASDDGWWPFSISYNGKKTFDGEKPGNIIISKRNPGEPSKFNCTWIHELGHAMGLPDYYKYKNTENGSQGMKGTAGTEMMDDGKGDMCAFSKLMYGWYKPSQVNLYSGGTQTFTLSSSQETGSCLIIPRDSLNACLSEYMVIEYATGSENNTGYCGDGGIRVMHCNAEYSIDQWGRPYLLWNNHSKYYDDSNEKQRVIRLANQEEGGYFYREGSVIDGSVSGFHWYDDDGYQTVDVGCTVTIGELADGKYTITVSQ